MIRPLFRALPGDETWAGQPAGARAELGARLWPKVRGPWCSGIDEEGDYFDVAEEDCWLWLPTTKTGAWRIRNGVRVKATVAGYGHIRWWDPERGRWRLIGAHVAAYLVGKGSFPRGFVIAHSCDQKLCCNPWHLVAMPQRDNVRDAVAKRRLAQDPQIKRWAVAS